MGIGYVSHDRATVTRHSNRPGGLQSSTQWRDNVISVRNRHRGIVTMNRYAAKGRSHGDKARRRIVP
jgi:hypothetical protein